METKATAIWLGYLALKKMYTYILSAMIHSSFFFF